jgi:hypothetical protein
MDFIVPPTPTPFNAAIATLVSMATFRARFSNLLYFPYAVCAADLKQDPLWPLAWNFL